MLCTKYIEKTAKKATRTNWQWDNIAKRQDKDIMRLGEHQESVSNGFAFLVYTDLQGGWYTMHKYICKSAKKSDQEGLTMG